MIHLPSERACNMLCGWRKCFRARNLFARNGQTPRRSRHGFRAASPITAQVQSLEPRLLLAAAFPEFVDPNPNAGNQFGSTAIVLSTGNVVVTSQFDDAGGTDAGA